MCAVCRIHSRVRVQAPSVLPTQPSLDSFLVCAPADVPRQRRRDEAACDRPRHGAANPAALQASRAPTRVAAACLPLLLRPACRAGPPPSLHAQPPALNHLAPSRDHPPTLLPCCPPPPPPPPAAAAAVAAAVTPAPPRTAATRATARGWHPRRRCLRCTWSPGTATAQRCCSEARPAPTRQTCCQATSSSSWSRRAVLRCALLCHAVTAVCDACAVPPLRRPVDLIFGLERASAVLRCASSRPEGARRVSSAPARPPPAWLLHRHGPLLPGCPSTWHCVWNQIITLPLPPRAAEGARDVQAHRHRPLFRKDGVPCGCAVRCVLCCAAAARAALCVHRVPRCRRAAAFRAWHPVVAAAAAMLLLPCPILTRLLSFPCSPYTGVHFHLTHLDERVLEVGAAERRRFGSHRRQGDTGARMHAAGFGATCCHLCTRFMPQRPLCCA